MIDIRENDHGITLNKIDALIVQIQNAIALFNMVNLNTQMFVRSIGLKRIKRNKTEYIRQSLTFQIIGYIV